MRRTLALLAVLGLVLVGLVAPAAADSDTRPFKAEFAGELSWNPSDCPFTELTTDSAAVGHATHMGKTAMTSSHCTPPGLEYGPGLMVLTAANGDELTLEYGGTCPPYFDLEVGELLTCTVDWDIADGTGHFEGAHGSGSGHVSIVWEGLTVPVMDGTWELGGTIGY